MDMSASMRPRHIAAENYKDGWLTNQIITLASMRPRHIAAENGPPAHRNTTPVATLQ